MKCPRCEYSMAEVKVSDSVYYYKCNKCGYTIGKPETIEQAETLPTKAAEEDSEEEE